MSGISLPEAQSLSIFLETFVYGIAFTLCAITFAVLIRPRYVGAKIEKHLVFVMLLMLMVATVHVIISFVQWVQAFVFPQQGVLPQTYYENLANPLLVANNTLFVVQSVLGDGVNIWRCYIVHSRRFGFIIIPLTIMVAGIVSGGMTLRSQARASIGTPIFEFSRWITALATTMMGTNIYCTSMTAWRIYTSSKNTHRYFSGSRSLFPIALVIVESGALYTSSLFAFLVVYLSKSNGQYPAVNMIPPLVPCIFCLIMLQIRLYRTTSQPPSQSSGSSRPSQNNIHDRQRRAAYAMQPLVVSVSTQAVEHRDDHGEFSSVTHKMDDGLVSQDIGGYPETNMHN